MSQKSLNERVRLARAAATARVLQKIEGGWRVPSRTQADHHIVLGKTYRTSSETGLRVTCHYDTRILGQHRCPGNQFGHVCWHVLASVLAASKKSVAFFEDKGEARKYSNFGGSLAAIKSGDGSGKLWAVIGGTK